MEERMMSWWNISTEKKQYESYNNANSGIKNNIPSINKLTLSQLYLSKSVLFGLSKNTNVGLHLEKIYNGIRSRRLMGVYYKKGLNFESLQLLKKFRSILPCKGGRNATGRITVRHRGGGKYRSFIQKQSGGFFFSDLPSKCLFSKQLGRKQAANFSFCLNSAGIFSYSMSPDKIAKSGFFFHSNKNITRKMTFSPGSRTTLRLVPTGSWVYNVELYPNAGAQIARSAGCKVKLMLKKKLHGISYAGIQLPSKKLIYVNLNCQASIGVASNPLHKLQDIGLAGIKRRQGFRPSVRGVAMNPVDHPHGGGEGKASSGPKPKTAWGKTWRFVKTRSKRKEMEFKIFVKRINKRGVNIPSVKKLY